MFLRPVSSSLCTLHSAFRAATVILSCSPSASLDVLLNIHRFEAPQRKIEYAMTQYIRRTNRRSGKNIPHIIYHTQRGENLTICPRVGYFPNVVYRFSRYNLRVQDRRSRLRSALVKQNAGCNVEWSRSIAQASPRGANKEQGQSAHQAAL